MGGTCFVGIKHASRAVGIQLNAGSTIRTRPRQFLWPNHPGDV